MPRANGFTKWKFYNVNNMNHTRYIPTRIEDGRYDIFYHV